MDVRIFLKIKPMHQQRVATIDLTIGVGEKCHLLVRAASWDLVGLLVCRFGPINENAKFLHLCKNFRKFLQKFLRDLQNFDSSQTKKITSPHNHAWSRWVLFFARRQF